MGASLAQLVERTAVNREVKGSIPLRSEQIYPSFLFLFYFFSISFLLLYVNERISLCLLLLPFWVTIIKIISFPLIRYYHRIIPILQVRIVFL
jgi:hypothetical protein